MQRRDRIDAAGAGLLILCSALMGANQALVKLVNAGFAPVFQAGLRSAFAFFPVLLFALLMRRKLSLTDGSFRPGVFSGLLFSAEFCILFLALDYTTVSRASIFFYTMPFWVALAAHWMIPGERLTVARVCGLLLAIGGVAVALADGASPPGDTVLLGDLMCLAAAMLWAAIALTLRTTRLARASPEMQLLYHLAVSALVITALAPLFGDLVRVVTPAIIAIFAFQVIVVVAFGFLLWFWVLTRYPASDMASFGFLAPVFGVFFGWLLLGDQLTPAILLALLLVGVGIALVNYKPRRPART